MRVISLCSGAGGLDLGLERAGHRTVALCEIDQWRRDLLRARFPGVPVYPDLTTLDPAGLPDADLLAGGTPCQDLSVAGRRAGLDGERSGLYWHFQRVRLALGIEWALWENVAGALSSNGGLDFAQVLAAFVGADILVPGGGWPGAGVAAGPWGGAVWRVLDAQHFGVPQRRRRVFVVGRLGSPCPPEVLLEPQGGGGNPAAGERSWQDLAGTVGGGAHGAGRRTPDDDNYVVAAPLTRGSARPGVSEPGRRKEDDVNIVSTLQARGSTGGFDIDPAMAAGGYLIAGGELRPEPASRGSRERHGGQPQGRRREAGAGLPGGEDRLDGAQAHADGVRAPDGLAGRVVRPVDGPPVSCIHPDAIGRDGMARTPSADAEGAMRLRDAGLGVQDDVAYTLATGAPPAVGPVPDSVGVACAFDPQPDGRRYAACGDGVVANVAEWIGRRLTEAHS